MSSVEIINTLANVRSSACLVKPHFFVRLCERFLKKQPPEEEKVRCIDYIGRCPLAASSTGNKKQHEHELKAYIVELFGELTEEEKKEVAAMEAKKAQLAKEEAVLPGMVDSKAAAKPDTAGPKAAAKPGTVDPKAAAKPGTVDPKAAAKPGTVDPKAAAKPGKVDAKVAAKPGSVDPKAAAKPGKADPKTTAKSAPSDKKATDKPKDKPSTSDKPNDKPKKK